MTEEDYGYLDSLLGEFYWYDEEDNWVDEEYVPKRKRKNNLNDDLEWYNSIAKDVEEDLFEETRGMRLDD